jgi:hypothetical protein
VSILTPASFASDPTVIEPIAAFIFTGYTLDLGPESRTIVQMLSSRSEVDDCRSDETKRRTGQIPAIRWLSLHEPQPEEGSCDIDSPIGGVYPPRVGHRMKNEQPREQAEACRRDNGPQCGLVVSQPQKHCIAPQNLHKGGYEIEQKRFDFSSLPAAGEYRAFSDFGSSRLQRRNRQIESKPFPLVAILKLAPSINVVGVPPRNSIQLAENQNVLGSEIFRLRQDAGFKQRELVTKLQAAGWDVSFETLCKIEKGDRTLTDVEFVFILRVLGKKWSDVQLPKVRFPDLDRKKK